MESMTRDHFFNGRIILNQPKSGYRFSIDAVILAHIVNPADADTVLDMGTGCGVIPVMLAYRRPDLRLIGVEIQTSLCRFARQNVAHNQMSDRITILEGDMVRLQPGDIGGPVDLVVTNPPYRKRGSGRINPDSQKAVARHEMKINLDSLLQTARRMLNPSGRLAIIYPAVRAVDLISAMRAIGLEPKKLTMIHSKQDLPAQLVAIEGTKGGRPGLAVGPPLVVYHRDGSYTQNVAAMFSG